MNQKFIFLFSTLFVGSVLLSACGNNTSTKSEFDTTQTENGQGNAAPPADGGQGAPPDGGGAPPSN
jgi:hypothetical protein